MKALDKTNKKTKKDTSILDGIMFRNKISEGASMDEIYQRLNNKKYDCIAEIKSFNQRINDKWCPVTVYNNELGLSSDFHEQATVYFGHFDIPPILVKHISIATREAFKELIELYTIMKETVESDLIELYKIIIENHESTRQNQ